MYHLSSQHQLVVEGSRKGKTADSHSISVRIQSFGSPTMKLMCDFIVRRVIGVFLQVI